MCNVQVQTGLYSYLMHWFKYRVNWMDMEHISLPLLAISVARNFEQKVAKFQKTPKDLHQSTFENPKYLHQSSSKRQKYLHQNTKRQILNWFKTSFLPNFQKQPKSSQKDQVAKRKFLQQIGVKSSQICDKSPNMATLLAMVSLLVKF